MGPQDPKDVTRDTARNLSALVGELAAMKADATTGLERVMNSIRNSLGMRETESAREPSRP
jgi:hypothetical protein